MTEFETQVLSALKEINLTMIDMKSEMYSSFAKINERLDKIEDKINVLEEKTDAIRSAKNYSGEKLEELINGLKHKNII